MRKCSDEIMPYRNTVGQSTEPDVQSHIPLDVNLMFIYEVHNDLCLNPWPPLPPI